MNIRTQCLRGQLSAGGSLWEVEAYQFVSECLNKHLHTSTMTADSLDDHDLVNLYTQMAFTVKTN